MILLANLASTLFLTGIAWSLQFVQLEILLPEQLALHRKLNSRLMAAPMSIEFVTAVWLAIVQPRPAPITALVLWLILGYATVRYSLLWRDPAKQAIIRRKKFWNLVRTVCWTARSAIMLWTTSMWIETARSRI
jgi:hypothetical protein